MTTNIDLLSDENIFYEENKYNNLVEKILDLTLDINVRMCALESYYNDNKEETIEIISRLNGMYQLSGISILEKFLLNIAKSNKLSIFLRLEATKALLMYTELDDDNNDELIYARNKKRLENSSKVLREICSNSDELPTPCRVESLYLLMRFEDYKEDAKTYFINLINDKNIECEYRYNTILSLECKYSEYIKEKLFDLFLNKDFVLEVFTEFSDLTKKEFPNFIPKIDNELFFQLLIKRMNFDLCRKMYNKYFKNISNYEYFIFNSHKSFLFCKSNMTYYKILSGQYLLQKFKGNMNDDIDVEKQLLVFAKDVELDYDRRADAADVLLQLGSPEMKKFGREIIMILGSIKGDIRTVFDNAQNVHTDEVESSVSEALEFFSMMPLHIVNKKFIEFDYVKEQIEKMLKDERESKIISYGNINCLYNCDICGIDNYYCNKECLALGEKERKIKVALNRISMDRALYSKYNNTLNNILIKVWSYLVGHENENEMRKRLLEELEEMSGTCSSGFASRLINVISGFGQFNIRISWEDQIIANFSGRLNAAARNIVNKDSIFYTKKYEDILKLWLNNTEQKELKEKLIKELNTTQYITENPTMSDIINQYLLLDKDEKVTFCIEYFSENVLNEMTLASSNTSNRMHFSLFFRTYVSKIREEMYKEFNQYLDDSTFDLFIRKGIMKYEGCY